MERGESERQGGEENGGARKDKVSRRGREGGR